MRFKENKGITLIALVVTIIVLIILAGLSINLILGNDGIMKKAQISASETKQEAAKEAMNLKITTVQIDTYAKEQRMPTLQELANIFCEDEDFEYVELTTKRQASLNKITVGENNSIFTKLKEYSYEFEINSSLQLESIDGIKIATTNNQFENKNSSRLIKKIDCQAIENSEISTKVDIVITKDLENEDSLLGYVIYINDQFYLYSIEDSIQVEDTADKIVKKIDIVAIDKEYNTAKVSKNIERTRKKYLYLKGNKVESWTRAWMDTKDVSWTNDSIYNSGDWYRTGVGYRTSNKIDLSGFSKVCFYYCNEANNTENIGEFGYSTNPIGAYNYLTNNSFTGKYITKDKYNGVITQTIDSNVTEAYVCFEFHRQAVLNVYGIWLQE